jgi:adenylate cyclase class IV
MTHLNIEFKARCDDSEQVKAVLRKYNARFHGRDHQIDTYFNCSQGRLKLREGDIENNLSHEPPQNM